MTEVNFSDPRGDLKVSAETFAAHCRTARVLGRKAGAPALLAQADPAGLPLMTKIWRPRGPFSSDRLVGYDVRFRRALENLSALGVPAPTYRAHGRVLGGSERFVIYEPLQGEVVRGRYAALDPERLADFVLGLHERGVYFRGLNLGNVVRCPDGRYGLIDVQDVRFLGRPLGLRRRERNLGILCAHPGDLRYMLDGHWSELVLAYCRRAEWTVTAAAHMREQVRRQIERRRARRAARRLRRGLEPLAVGEYGSGTPTGGFPGGERAGS